jgi:hypothetical protein
MRSPPCRPAQCGEPHALWIDSQRSSPSDGSPPGSRQRARRANPCATQARGSCAVTLTGSSHSRGRVSRLRMTQDNPKRGGENHVPEPAGRRRTRPVHPAGCSITTLSWRNGCSTPTRPWADVTRPDGHLAARRRRQRDAPAGLFSGATQGHRRFRATQTLAAEQARVPVAPRRGASYPGPGPGIRRAGRTDRRTRRE